MLFGAGFGNFNLRVNKMSQSVFEIITNKIIEKLSEYVEIDVLKINVELDKK